MKANKIIFNILTVFAYFYGVFLLASIVLLPVGIYAIIAANRYGEFAEMNAFTISQNKQRIKNWIIFGCVAMFPIGLLGLICLRETTNNIKVEDTTETTSETQEQKTEATDVEIHEPVTAQEKAEKLAKLERFKQNGLITEEEFEQAKAQLYSED